MPLDSHAEPTLHYVADPLCSWCWGFSPVIRELGQDIRVRYRMGGLAADSDRPMDAETREYVRAAWESVARATGARFDRSLWDVASPRRSTWPACRAVIAADLQREGGGAELFHRFQRAFYTEAIDVTNPDSFADLAASLSPPLDSTQLLRDIAGDEVAQRFEQDLQFALRLRVRQFPSLVLEREGDYRVVQRGWAPLEQTVAALAQAGA